jgi:hypothetical protein
LISLRQRECLCIVAQDPERSVMPRRALSVRPWSVDVGAAFDGYDGDALLVVVDAVDHAVITTARALQPFETYTRG